MIANIAATHAALQARGYEPAPIMEFKRGDELLARFSFSQNPDGDKIEMPERNGRYQRRTTLARPGKRCSNLP